MFEPILTDYLVNEKNSFTIFWLFDAFNQFENIFDAYSLTFKVTFDPKARVFGLYGKNWSIFGHFWAQNKILGHFSKFWQIFDQIWSILPDFCPNSNFHWNFKEAPCTWYVHFFWSNEKQKTFYAKAYTSRFLERMYLYSFTEADACL